MPERSNSSTPARLNASGELRQRCERRFFQAANAVAGPDAGARVVEQDQRRERGHAHHVDRQVRRRSRSASRGPATLSTYVSTSRQLAALLRASGRSRPGPDRGTARRTSPGAASSRGRVHTNWPSSRRAPPCRGAHRRGPAPSTFSQPATVQRRPQRCRPGRRSTRCPASASRKYATHRQRPRAARRCRSEPRSGLAGCVSDMPCRPWRQASSARCSAQLQ